MAVSWNLQPNPESPGLQFESRTTISPPQSTVTDSPYPEIRQPGSVPGLVNPDTIEK